MCTEFTRTRQDVKEAVFPFEVCRQLCGNALRHVIRRQLLNVTQHKINLYHGHQVQLSIIIIDPQKT